MQEEEKPAEDKTSPEVLAASGGVTQKSTVDSTKWKPFFIRCYRFFKCKKTLPLLQLMVPKNKILMGKSCSP